MKLDQTTLALFSSQHGVATLGQLIALRLSPRTIGCARERGELTPVLPGVYRLGGGEPSFEARAMAVQLHCGEACFLTGTTVIRPDGLRLADPYLMLLALARQFNDHRFERAAEEHSPAQSGLEQDFVAAIRSVGLPEPQRQYPLRLLSGESIRLDLAWPEVKLAVEPGHSWWHGGDLGVRRDIARDRACGEVGWYVARYDESAREDPAAVGRELLNTYRQRRPA